jgi:hypothetical protein
VTEATIPQLEALARLITIARGNTGQCRRVADFLLAWHNADDNGGWGPSDLWSVDSAIADDIVTVIGLIRATTWEVPWRSRISGGDPECLGAMAAEEIAEEEAMMREWADETDADRAETGEMLLKHLKGEDPWECRRKNRRLWLVLAVSIAGAVLRTLYDRW